MPRKSWWARLPFGVRMTAGVSALLVLVGGGAAGIATMTTPEGTPSATTEAATEPDPGAARLEEDPEVVSRAAAAAQPLPKRHAPTPPPPTTPTAGRPAGTDQLSRARVADERADRTGPRPERPAGGRDRRDRREPVAAPVVTTRTDVETRTIPFQTKVIRDHDLPRGARYVQSPGAPGEETVRYLVTLTDGRQTSRRLLGTTVTRKPENRVVVFGAHRKSALDPECEQALSICVPLGRTAAMCPPETTAGPAATPLPGTVVTEEDLLAAGEELIDGVRLEPASLC